MDGNKFSYEWIETLPRLEGVARILGQVKVIGVDLEADSLLFGTLFTIITFQTSSRLICHPQKKLALP
jgi:hypothetical protein